MVTEPVETRESADADANVPYIGTRWLRWYDAPYRLLSWLLQSWRRRVIPWKARELLNRGRGFLLAFNEYDRLKMERPGRLLDDITVPEGESVTQGGIWVAELFPPSNYPGLKRALERNGWDVKNRLTNVDGTNAEAVTDARRGRGYVWSRIGSVVDSMSDEWPAFDAKRERLPPEFALIELTVIQLGQSLTAVVAGIRLSPFGSQCLNREWTAKHEPSFRWRGRHRPLGLLHG